MYDGRSLAKLADQSWNFGWLGVAGGNISSSTAGDEMALSRSDVQATLPSVLIFRLSGGSLVTCCRIPPTSTIPTSPRLPRAT